MKKLLIVFAFLVMVSASVEAFHVNDSKPTRALLGSDWLFTIKIPEFAFADVYEQVNGSWVWRGRCVFPENEIWAPASSKPWRLYTYYKYGGVSYTTWY